MSKITLQSAKTALDTLRNTNPTFTIPTGTKNKGIVGHILEDKLNIPHTSDCLDCEDGEIKAFPLKTLKNGQIKSKETVAVTMANPSSLTVPFEEHRVGKKLKNTLFVPYTRTGDSVTLMAPFIFNDSNPKYKQLERDYNQIVESYKENGRLQSSVGEYLQTRTKGAKNSNTRAFYLKTKFTDEELEASRKSQLL